MRHAVARCGLNTMKDLVNQGVDIHAGKDLALYWAVFNNHKDIINYLENCERKK